MEMKITVITIMCFLVLGVVGQDETFSPKQDEEQEGVAIIKPMLHDDDEADLADKLQADDPQASNEKVHREHGSHDSSSSPSAEKHQQNVSDEEARRICHLPAETGMCRAYFPRFFFNSSTNECETFIYGGCDGNENNFPTEEDCLQACGQFGESQQQQSGETTTIFLDPMETTTTAISDSSSDSNSNENNNDESGQLEDCPMPNDDDRR